MDFKKIDSSYLTSPSSSTVVLPCLKEARNPYRVNLQTGNPTHVEFVHFFKFLSKYGGLEDAYLFGVQCGMNYGGVMARLKAYTMPMKKITPNFRIPKFRILRYENTLVFNQNYLVV